jgi:hypothetical protein
MGILSEIIKRDLENLEKAVQLEELLLLLLLFSILIVLSGIPKSIELDGNAIGTGPTKYRREYKRLEQDWESKYFIITDIKTWA